MLILNSKNYKYSFIKATYIICIYNSSFVQLIINSFYTVLNNSTDGNDYFSVAVRTIQQYGEVYFVGAPTATSFVVAVAIDTMNSAATSSNVEVFNTAYPTLGTFGGLSAQLLTALGSWGSGVVTISQLTASGATIQ